MAEQWTGHNGPAAISENVKSPQPVGGDQLNFLVDRRQAVTSAVVSSEELDRVRSCYVPVEEYGSMLECLRKHQVVLLAGQSGTGRMTTALHLLDELTAGKVSRWDSSGAVQDIRGEDLEPGRGYLIELAVSGWDIPEMYLDRLGGLLGVHGCYCVLVEGGRDTPAELSIEELIARSSVGGETDPELDWLCADEDVAAFLSRSGTFTPLQCGGDLTPKDMMRPREAGVCLVQSRDVSRAANSAVDVSESLAVPGRDLRVMSCGDREETWAGIAQLRKLLSRCPAGAFGAEGSAMILTTVATLSGTLIADRDERAALRLIRTAAPHLEFLGRRHSAVLDVRRVWAEALSELGWYPQAEKVLRRLSEDEQRVFGSDDPRTALLLLWVLVGSGRSQEAESGFRALEARLTQPQGVVTPLLLHLRCRYSWLLGQQRLVNESASGYDGVIIHRSHELGDHHADTLDAQHSKGKMLVFNRQGSQAVTLLQALADDRAHVQGDHHPDTLETQKYLYLAQVQTEPRDDRVVDRAISELVEIHRIQQERYGQDHPVRQDTAVSLRKLLRGEPIFGLQHVPIADDAQRQTIPRSRSSRASRNTPSTSEQLAR